jgi:hypothetical protein
MNIFKVGFLCLIGIAHLPDSMNKLRFYKSFELRPCISTDIGNLVEEEMNSTPKHASLVVLNLFAAIKMICEKTIHLVPISGNVEYEKEDEILNKHN